MVGAVTRLNDEEKIITLKDRVRVLDALYNHFCKYERHRNPAMFDLIMRLKYEAEIKIEKHEKKTE